MSRIFAIGDIHGCLAALDAILDDIQPGRDDLIIPLGDYVDRGPDSRGVIARLIELQSSCQLAPLRGNHELMMLAALDSSRNQRFWLQCGGLATIQSYDNSLGNVPESHVEFLRGCRPFHETERHFYVHANYDPDLPLDEQPERLLYWEHLMFYDNGIHTIPGRHASGKIGVVGHTPQENGLILDLGDVICIDTFCVGTGRLTAIEMQSGRLCQADKNGKLLTPFSSRDAPRTS